MEHAYTQKVTTKYLRDKVFMEGDDTYDLRNQIVQELQMLEEMFDEGFSENNWKKIARYVNERKDYMKEKIKGFARTN